MKWFWFSLAVLPLCACAQVSGFVTTDAKKAEAIAASAGDTAAVPCYAAIGSLAAIPPTGLLSKFEAARAANSLAQGPCAPVFAGLALHVLNKVPGTP